MTPEQETIAITMIVKPFVLLALLGALLLIRLAVIRWFPEGKIKKLLLIQVKKSWR
jgi:hypothetical protein